MSNFDHILSELQGYDWKEAFTYAHGYSISDVEEIIAMAEGENDGADWIIFGKLKDGRWFTLSAGCDYTGWDCQAGGSGEAWATENDAIRHGMTRGMRERFNLLQPEDLV